MAEDEDKKFKRERSHRDADASNANARAAAQAAILINGGAATAILASLAQWKGNAHALHTAAFGLAVYAAGVFFGACMMWSLGRALDWWSRAWLEEADIGSRRHETQKLINGWYYATWASFVAAAACFIVASVLLAIMLHRLPPS